MIVGSGMEVFRGRLQLGFFGGRQSDYVRKQESNKMGERNERIQGLSLLSGLWGMKHW